MVADEVFWKSLWNNLCIASAPCPESDRARDRDGAVGQLEDGRAHVAPDGVLHAHVPADDRGREHLALLLHAAVRLLEQVLRPSASQPQLARHPRAPRSPCVTVVAIWKEAGFFMIFYLAALQSIPPSLAEAAALEGASRAYYFRRVVFPLLMPTDALRDGERGDQPCRLVDHIVVMTRGGPNNAHDAAALPRLPGGVQLLGSPATRPRSRGAAGAAGRGGAGAVRVPRQAVHYQ
jgi:sn-glycerol 3-phosphate transport system permease protein